MQNHTQNIGRSNSHSGIFKYISAILAFILVALVIYAVFFTSYFSTGKMLLFWSFLGLAFIFQLLFQLSIERRLGNVTISVNLLTFVQGLTLVGSLMLLENLKNPLIWFTLGFLGANLAVNLVLTMVYRIMRIRWKQFIRKELLQIMGDDFKTIMPITPYCDEPKTKGDLHTDLAELTELRQL